jgi:hypothetical protein
MENKQHLPVGSQLDGHYEIIEVLGEDDFEILYLVKDTHRLQTMFVIKELFLKKISLRTENKEILTLQKSKDIFEDTKQELILEAQKLQKSHYKKDAIQTYGYFEENNTIYIIMEFVNDAGLNSYLDVRLKAENRKIRPTVKEEYGQRQEKPKSTIFLKILLVAVFVFIGLAFYAYKMIEENKKQAKEEPTVVVTNTPLNHPELTNRFPSTPSKVKVEEHKKKEIRAVPSGAEYITTDENTPKVSTEVSESLGNIPQDEIYINNEEEEYVKKETTFTEKPKEEFQVPYVAPIPSISLGTKIENTPNQNSIQNNSSISLGTPIKKESIETFTQTSVKNFLTTFIASSATGSAESIASHYDDHVEQYFSLRNVDHSKIKKDKRRYNRKWTHRSFEIASFKIVKIYKKNNNNYCNVRTRTNWKVSTNSGKHASGTSRGFMTIKNTDNGFKVTSIYTLK